jgi:hypothetical protein
MEKWEMMCVRATGTTGLGTYEHFEPREWSTGDIKKDKSAAEKDHYPAVHRFIMELLDEGWEPLTITYAEPTFAVKRTDYLFRRLWQEREEEEEDEEEEEEGEEKEAETEQEEEEDEDEEEER